MTEATNKPLGDEEIDARIADIAAMESELLRSRAIAKLAKKARGTGNTVQVLTRAVQALRRALRAEEGGTVMLAGNATQGEIARSIIALAKMGDAVFDRARFWLPDAGACVWVPVPEEPLRKIVFEATMGAGLRHGSTDGHTNGILRAAGTLLHSPLFDEAPLGFGTPDGAFRRIDGGKLVEEKLSLDHCQTALLPFAPVEGPMPLWHAHLQAHVVEDDQIALLQEMFGATLGGVMWRMKGAGALLGDQDTGKSVALNVLRGLVPPEWCCSVPPEKFGHEYSRAELAGKRLCTAGDITANTPVDDGAFKELTGGDSISARPIYHKPFSFVNTAAIWWSGNRMPMSRDKSEAFFDRAYPIQHFNPVPEEKQDRFFVERLLGQEGPAITAWAMEGLQRMLAQGRFTETASRAQIIHEWRMQADSLLAFLHQSGEMMITGHPEALGHWVPAKDFYRLYERWCRESCLTPMGRTRVYAELRQAEYGRRGVRLLERAQGARIKGVTRIPTMVDQKLFVLMANKGLDLCDFNAHGCGAGAE